MTSMKRVLLVVSLNFLGILLLGALNRHLAPLAIQIFLPGLFLLFPALFLPFFQGLVAVILTAILLDTSQPSIPGSFVVAGLLLITVTDRFRHRLKSEEVRYTLVSAVAANTAVMVFFAVTHGATPASRFFADLTFATVGIIVLGGWFLELQARSLEWLGLRPHPDEFRPST